MESSAFCVDYAEEWTDMRNDGYGNFVYDDEVTEVEDKPTVQYAEGFVFINVYELYQGYGGAEEGGWWFDCGTLITGRQVPVADSERVKAELQAEYPTADQAREMNEHMYYASLAEDPDAAPMTRQAKYWETSYTGGDYRVYIEDKPGADFPEYTPRYE